MTLQNNERTLMIKRYMEKAQESLNDSEIEANSHSTRINRAYY